MPKMVAGYTRRSGVWHGERFDLRAAIVLLGGYALIAWWRHRGES